MGSPSRTNALFRAASCAAVVVCLGVCGVMGAAEPGRAEPERAESARAEPGRDRVWPEPLAARVAEASRLNFEGAYDRAEEIWRELGERYPDHPAPALFATETLYFKQIYDDRDRRYDDAIEDSAQRALSRARDLLRAHPESARAELFVGHAEMLLGRLDGARARFYRAGRHAEIAQGHLERALEIDPTLLDASYWLGVYYFYASTLPEFVQELSWLWFVPEADRAFGLRAVEEASVRADLQRAAARLVLLNIYIYHEPRWQRAREIAEALHAEFPRNTLIHFELLETLLYQRDFTRAVAVARTLETRDVQADYDRGRVNMARIWRARAHLGLGELDLAARALDAVESDPNALPTWGEGWRRLVRGSLLLERGKIDEARAELAWAVENRDRSRRAGARAEGILARLDATPTLRARRPGS